jgi:predicted nuclease of predicted toxin-antitoxin system
MKFLVDAHLPPSLCGLLQAAGHDARHTHQLPAKNLTPDTAINLLSAREKLVVVSKDTDFYYSHLLRQQPYKLVLVRTGNIGIRELKTLFARNLPAIEKALKKHSLVELDRSSVRVVV